MTRTRAVGMLFAGVGGLLGLTLGCDTTGPIGPPPGNEPPALVKTRISLRYGGSTLDAAGKIDVGDDLVVFGILTRGIFYLVPSQADKNTNTATSIPNSATLFDERSFAVAGKKVAVVRSNESVSIFDTTNGTLADIPATTIRLDPFALPVDANKPGHMQAEWPYIATINAAGSVSDGRVIKVIDVSGATPTVISFPNPTGFLGDFNQVAVDANTRRVAAHGTNPGDVLYVWSIDNPTAAPLAFNFFTQGGFSDNVQFRFDGNTILYQTGPSMGDWNIALFTLPGGTITPFTNNPTQNGMPLALTGGKFGYFLWRETADEGPDATEYRSAIGAVSTAPASTLASQTDLFPSDRTDCQSRGHIGYGATVAIVPDGSRWFLAGFGPISEEYDQLQMSTGGAFVAFDDAEGDTLSGLVMATDVVASSTTVAFRALRQEITSGCLTNDDWVLGFIVLDRLE